MKTRNRRILLLVVAVVSVHCAGDDDDDDVSSDEDSDDDQTDDDDLNEDDDDDIDDDDTGSDDDSSPDDDTVEYPECPPYEENARLFLINDFFNSVYNFRDEFGGAADCTVVVSGDEFSFNCETQEDVITGTWLRESAENPLVNGADIQVAGSEFGADDLTGILWVIDTSDNLLIYHNTNPYTGINPLTRTYEDMSLTTFGVSEIVCEYKNIDEQPPIFNDNFRWDGVFGGDAEGGVGDLTFSSDTPQSTSLIGDGEYRFASVENHFGHYVPVDSKNGVDESIHREIQIVKIIDD